MTPKFSGLQPPPCYYLSQFCESGIQIGSVEWSPVAPTGWYSDWDGLGDPGWLPPQTWHLGGDGREAGPRWHPLSVHGDSGTLHVASSPLASCSLSHHGEQGGSSQFFWRRARNRHNIPSAMLWIGWNSQVPAQTLGEGQQAPPLRESHELGQARLETSWVPSSWVGYLGVVGGPCVEDLQEGRLEAGQRGP